MEDNQENVNSEVVFGINKEIWKNIVDSVTGYEVSNFGNVRVNVNGEYKKVSKFEYKTTKGTYLYSKVFYPNIGLKAKAIHQLVTMAFLGDPPDDGKLYEPNHKDGNKHNNHVTNLEWMTRSQNVLHAFETGLCTVGVRVTVKDLLNNTKKVYNSFSSLARDLNLSRERLRTIISKHKTKPYLDRWTFNLDNSSDKKIERYQAVKVICKDYVSNEIYITNDAIEMSELTNILAGTITLRVRDNTFIKDRLSLIGGYVFKKLSDETPWPTYSKREAIISREKYLENLNESKVRENWLRKNYITGEISEHKSLNEASKDLNLSIGRICDMSVLHKKGKIPFVKGYAFKKVSNKIPWPVIDNLQLQISLNNELSSRGGRAIRVFDTILNTTKIYASGANFAREVGLNPNTITVQIRDCKSNLFLDKYKIEFLS